MLVAQVELFRILDCLYFWHDLFNLWANLNWCSLATVLIFWVILLHFAMCQVTSSKYSYENNLLH